MIRPCSYAFCTSIFFTCRRRPGSLRRISIILSADRETCWVASFSARVGAGLFPLPLSSTVFLIVLWSRAQPHCGCEYQYSHRHRKERFAA